MCENSRVITYANTSDLRERWLWTQSIQKSVPAPDEYPVRVFVNVTVSPSTTSSMNDSLELQIQHADRNVSQIHYIDKDNPVQFYFDIAKGEDGFSLALKGPPTGMAIVSRVLVYRHECQPLGFAGGPIQAPVIGSVSVVPDCVENSHQSDLLKCTAEGDLLNPTSACECDLGYYKVSNNSLISCEGKNKRFISASRVYRWYPSFTALVTLYGTYDVSTDGTYLLSVMETPKDTIVCFTSYFHANISVQIVTRDETAIGMFNN